jgi:hypothetical protein
VTIFIVVKFQTRPDWMNRWPGLVQRFTAATRAEPGNLWFDSPDVWKTLAMYVLVAACCDAEAGAARPAANGCSEMAALTII